MSPHFTTSSVGQGLRLIAHHHTLPQAVSARGSALGGDEKGLCGQRVQIQILLIALLLSNCVTLGKLTFLCLYFLHWDYQRTTLRLCRES